MGQTVTPGNLNETQFDVGAPAVPNKISILPGAFAQSGAGAPVAAPGPGESPWYVDTSTAPYQVYWHDGAAWNLTGDGVGGGGAADGVLTGLTLGAGNILSAALSVGGPITVDLSSLAGGGGGADGVVSNVVLNGTDLEFTGAAGGFNGTVDLSSLAGGGGGGGVTNTVTGNAPLSNVGTNVNAVMELDQAALVTALCARPDFMDCVAQIALGLIRDDGDGTFTAAHATDGAGNFVYNDCP